MRYIYLHLLEGSIKGYRENILTPVYKLQ